MNYIRLSNYYGLSCPIGFEQFRRRRPQSENLKAWPETTELLVPAAERLQPFARTWSSSNAQSPAWRRI